jgi:PEP-CTERM motif
MIRKIVGRACARTFQVSVGLLTVAAVAGLTAPSSAALMGTYSLELDGHVKSGANVGVEGHFNPSIPYIVNNVPTHTLPANVDPPAPLLEARDLLVSETEAANHIIISITNNTQDAKLGAIFNNQLDPAFDVLWEGIFSWDLGAQEKIAITSIGLEQGNAAPYPPPTSQTITGKGSVASPLRVSLQLDPSLFNLTPNNQLIGPLKIHLDYTRMNIPEPATAALALFGLVGISGLSRCRR